MKRTLTVLGVLCLCASAFAGNYIVTPTESLIYLDSPPPGATHMEIRIAQWSNQFVYGVESLDDRARCFDVTVQHGARILDGSTELFGDRMFATPQSFCATAWDGTTDFGGTSGATWSEYKSKGATPWHNYNALPSVLTLQRRTVFTHPGDTSSYTANQSTFFIEWTWL